MTRGARVGSKVDASPPRGDARRGSRFASRARRWRGRFARSSLTPPIAGDCSPRSAPSPRDGGHERRPSRFEPGRNAPRRWLCTERGSPRSRVACPACVSPPRWRSGATRCRSVATRGRGKNWRCERFDEWRGASWRRRSTDSAPTARMPGVRASYSRGAARGGVTARRPPRLTRGGSRRKKNRSSARRFARRCTACAPSAWLDRLPRGVTRGATPARSLARGRGARGRLSAARWPRFAPR